MKYTSRLFIVMSLLLSQFGLAAQLTNELNNYLQEVYENHTIPGFAVVVVKNNELVYAKGFGTEKYGSKKRFTPATVSAIGSLTKSITAMAIMQLVEEEKLKLDDRVIDYLPDFKTANKSKSDKITVRMLLNNTAGLNANPSPSYSFSGESLQYLAESLKSTFLTREPGTSYEYSNTDFSIAGLLIQKISGLPYEEYIEQHVFRPLKMNSSSSKPSKFERLGAIKGHHFGLKPLVAQQSVFQPSGEYIPAGSMTVSTAWDLGNYLMALLNNGKLGDNQVLSEESIAEMWTANISFQGLTVDDGGDGQKYQYGLGWMISKIEGRELIHHGGSMGTMSSFTMIDKANKTATTLLFNLDLTFIDKHRFLPHYTMANNVLHIANGKEPSAFGIPKTADKTLNAFELNAEDKKKYVGKYHYTGGGFPWMNFGLKWQIYLNAEGNLQVKVEQGTEILNEFLLDFVNPTLAVSRNIAGPGQLRFVLSRSGYVDRILWSGISYEKEKQISKSTHKLVSLQKDLHIHLPKSWMVQITTEGFVAKDMENPGAIIKALRSTSSAMKAQPLKRYLDLVSISASGIITQENRGTSLWEKQSFLAKNNLIQTVFREKNKKHPHVLILSATASKSTEDLSSVIGPILNELSRF